jgi:inner membrane transporter RhtA
MVLMQAGLASSVSLIDSLGPIHTSAYRLLYAASIVTTVCLVRTGREMRRLFTIDTFLLGIAMAGMAIFFSIAIANMPLAVATCIEFLGPLAVVCIYQKTARSLMLVGGALLGIYLMLVKTQDDRTATHIWSAFAAAVCWAGYIVLGKRISLSDAGIFGICPALLTAACTSLMIGACETGSSVGLGEAGEILIITLLYPLGPYVLDLLALKSLKQSTFGMLTSAEPVIALAIGIFTLGQTLSYVQVAGLSLVVLANAASLTERNES